MPQNTEKPLLDRHGVLFFNPSAMVSVYLIMAGILINRGGVQLEAGALFFNYQVSICIEENVNKKRTMIKRLCNYSRENEFMLAH